MSDQGMPEGAGSYSNPTMSFASQYQPTWRDQLARFLMAGMGAEDRRLGPMEERLVRGLTGSTGNSGAHSQFSVMDAVPGVGVATMGADMATDLAREKYLHAAVHGLGALIPFGVGRYGGRSLERVTERGTPGTMAHDASIGRSMDVHAPPPEFYLGWSTPSRAVKYEAPPYNYMPTPAARDAREGVVTIRRDRVPSTPEEAAGQRLDSVDPGAMFRSDSNGMKPGFLIRNAQNANPKMALTDAERAYMNAQIQQQGSRPYLRVVD